jgi:integrase
MKRKPRSQLTTGAKWYWPIDLSWYDQTRVLLPAEEEAFNKIANRPQRLRRTYINAPARLTLYRLVTPLSDCLDAFGASKISRTCISSIIIQEMVRRRVPFWGWSEQEWKETICNDSTLFRQTFKRGEGYRMDLIATAYLLRGITDFIGLGPFSKHVLAEKVFGSERLREASQPIADLLRSWGLGTSMVKIRYPRLIAELLLLNGSPLLADLTSEIMVRAREGKMDRRAKGLISMFTKALAEIRNSPLLFLRVQSAKTKTVSRAVTSGVPQEWAEWCVRWIESSTASQSQRNHVYYTALKVGRWLADKRPEVRSPAQWSRELSIEWIACVDGLTIGQYTDHEFKRRSNVGKPLRPTAKQSLIGDLRAFFKDLQEWELIPRKFDPLRTLATPTAISRLTGPDPRVIDADMWAKLLHAGLNVTAQDLPQNVCGNERLQRFTWYPLRMVQALATVWLFAGLRADEVRRLRVGCIRWQHNDLLVNPTLEIVPKGSICLLDVPTNKTSSAFTKPVDPLLGEAIAAWEKVRPPQPVLLDQKTGAMVHYLFSYRSHRVGQSYLNSSLIPLLCRKAGIPEVDARGRITSHRARATLATQLYNAKHPLTLFELQEWLGHRTPSATQHYAKVTPTKLARAYADADYFRTNLRMIDVLIDREAVKSGAATRGEPWQYYDLGHGYCAYDFFEQCVHRMACAKCSFYQPKEAMEELLNEGKVNLSRMMREIKLTDEEKSAVEDGVEALNKLTARLAAVPSPDGQTPQQLVKIAGSKSS